MPRGAFLALSVRLFFFQALGLTTSKPTSVANTTVSSKPGSLRECFGWHRWPYRLGCSSFGPLPYYREDDIRLEQNRILPEGSWLGRCLVELFARISSKTFSKGPCIKTLKQTSVSSRPVASKAGSVSQVPRGHFLPHRFECIF